MHQGVGACVDTLAQDHPGYENIRANLRAGNDPARGPHQAGITHAFILYLNTTDLVEPLLTVRGYLNYLLDPADPWPEGYRVADTWGVTGGLAMTQARDPAAG